MQIPKDNLGTDIAIWAIVPAAGTGQRMGTELPKQYLKIQDKRIIEITLSVLLSNPSIKQIVVARSQEDEIWSSLTCSTDPRIIGILGGSSRAQSVYNGLLELEKRAQPEDWVLVHDAARPCLGVNELNSFIQELNTDLVGGILALPAKDTLKQASPDNISAVGTLDRERVWQAQTPQMFRYEMLRSAMKSAIGSNLKITDEASAIEYAGHQPRLIESRSNNLKITTPQDLEIASFLLSN